MERQLEKLTSHGFKVKEEKKEIEIETKKKIFYNKDRKKSNIIWG